MPEAAEEVVVVLVAQSEAGCWDVARTGRGCAGGGNSIRYGLRVGRATHSTRPVNSVGLLRIGRDFNQACFDHDLLGRLIDLDQQLADCIDVAASFAEENGVSPLVYLRGIFAGQLRCNQRGGLFRPRIAKLVAVALGWFSGALGAGFDVIDVVDL